MAKRWMLAYHARLFILRSQAPTDMTNHPSLREKLNRGEGISAPGVFDPFSARIAEAAGYEVLYMTGYGVNATLLGQPDAGNAGFSQMLERLRAISLVTDASIVADGDTGFGGLANVQNAVVGYEMAGADAIQLEDQEFPKRCGHTRNRRVVPKQDMVNKVKVACESRSSEDFQIIARTDALTEHGLDEACHRAEAYREAGADVLFIESPEDVEQMTAICERFPDVPLVANMVAGGRTPMLEDAALFDLGFSLVIHPIYLLGAALSAMQEATKTLSQGREQSVADIHELNKLLDFAHVWELDQRFAD